MKLAMLGNNAKTKDTIDTLVKSLVIRNRYTHFICFFELPCSHFLSGLNSLSSFSHICTSVMWFKLISSVACLVTENTQLNKQVHFVFEIFNTKTFLCIYPPPTGVIKSCWPNAISWVEEKLGLLRNLRKLWKRWID